ncbi:hypothetical protein BHE97_05610 [Aeromicrobium sp. PE09-221]|uniref:SAF domain-containing protein n=1 Tax=Aeromicrobium sp. PE09-221 TaxID=1898043 RepID=UPI000B6AEDD5|nr:SAF domain-containing protein [Aeromicrobium sp. PE09-221]OUZ11311.1 hypothetical protein BHE97_05610 [Aeromicrobium sp. PE09-221]
MATDTRSTGTSVDDRQRERAQRGIGSRSQSKADGRPAPPKRRRPAIAVIGVLLIVGGAALAGLLALRMDSRDPVVVLSTDVPAGTQISTDMLAQTNVASDSGLLIPAGQVDEIVGTYAKTALSEGQLLDTTMLVQSSPFSGDVAQVGVTLAPGRVPVGLRSGDLVRVARLGDGQSPVRPLATAIVLQTSSGDGGGGLAGGGEAGATASLLVPSGAADAVVDAAGNDVLGLSLIERGLSPEEDADRLDTLGGDDE